MKDEFQILSKQMQRGDTFPDCFICWLLNSFFFPNSFKYIIKYRKSGVILPKY